MEATYMEWRTHAITAAAIGQTSFVLLYLLWPWYKNFLGRSLFFKSLALMLLLDMGVLFRHIVWAYEDLAFTILYTTFAVGVWVQVVAFLRVKYRREEPPAIWRWLSRTFGKGDSRVRDRK